MPDPSAPSPTEALPAAPALAPAPAEARPGDLDLDGIASELAAVESALERLDAGEYGRCAACGDPIGDDLLDGDPTALTCAAHLRL